MNFVKEIFHLLIVSCSLTGFYQEEKYPELMDAARKADITWMRKLINAGADVNESYGCDQPHAGRTPLAEAIESKSLDTVSLLLSAGARVNGIVTSPLIYDEHICKSNVRNLSILSHAINIKAPIEIIEALLKKGAHVDGSPKIWGDWSALMIAAFRGYTQAVELLLKSGADKNSVNSMDSKTALDYAKEQNHIDIIKLLE